MFLRQLKVGNLRSIRELELSFVDETGAPRKWTYLLGENGTGKSSVLRCVALALAGSEAAAELIGTPDDWIKLDQDEARIELDFANMDGDARSSVLTLRRGMTPLEFVDYNRSDLQQIDSAVARSERNYFVVGYGVTRRPQGSRHSFGDSASIYRSRRARSVATLFNPDVTLTSLEQWAMDLEYRKGRTGLAAVRKALNTLLPDVKFDGIDRDRRQLMFETPDGKLPLGALSDGYQAMAAWCGDLLWQITETFVDYKDPLAARGLLLIDEVDIHLHPLWQRRLVSFLDETLPNVQVIATTHSPLTVHQAGEHELYVLKRDDARGAVLHKFDGAPNRLLLPQLIQSPLFGLSSLDSPQVQALRDELRALQGIGEPERKLAPKQAQRVRQIERQLKEASNWGDLPPYLARTNRLLEEIADKLVPSGQQDDPLGAIAAASNPRNDPAAS